MRALTLAALLAAPSPAAAQAVVTSPGPERVSVTVYRNPDRGTEPLRLSWLGGYALVSETRRVSLPAGSSELRFEGVTSGIVPQSAIVTGLGEAVLEKNRDARLLSPGALLDASLGERLLLRRTSKATGAVREQDAIVRATNEGVVIQTAEGVESLRCTGLPETLLARQVPVGLSAKPTLSVRVRSPVPVERDVTLSYISNNFDWQTDYVAELSDAGDRMSLFGWLTMANGDQTGLQDAQAQAVAGKLNRDRVWVPAGEAKPIRISCWPEGTTSDIPEDDRFEITVTGSRMNRAAPMAPPPPPAAAAERGGEDEMVIAQEEALGDVRLYRIPITVTVAARSQKQIAMIRQPVVKISNVLRFRPPTGAFETGLPRLLLTRNEKTSGLGLALPAGKVTVFGRAQGRRVLIGQGRIDDYTIGEKVEIPMTTSNAVRARQINVPQAEGGGYELTLSNSLSLPQFVEVELPLEAKSPTRLQKRDGWMLWGVTVPANGQATLHYRL